MAQKPRLTFWLVFALAWAIYSYFRCPPTWANEHIRLAWNLWHRHAWNVDGTAPWEHVDVLGHSYELHPVGSALICLPFVAFGFYDQTAISVLVGAVGVALCWRMLARSIDNFEDEHQAHEYDHRSRSDNENPSEKENKRIAIHWLTLFFAFGTVYFYEATLGASWGFCLVLSTLPTFAALTELFGKCRPLLIGTFAALAFYARTDLALVWPVYVIWCWQRRGFAGVWCIVPMLVALDLYIALNEVRFHSPFDPTLRTWFEQDANGGKIFPWGPFSIRYLPLGIFTALFAGPKFQLGFPWLRPVAFGQSLLTTSPALFLAFRAKSVDGAMLALATLASAVAYECVWSNGVEQFSCRYVAQTLPFLLALMAQTPLDRFAKTLILASILFCCWGTYSVRVFGWG